MNLQFWDNVHHPLCVMCHMSGVTFHVSHVTCHKVCVTCHMLCVTWHHYSQTVRDRDLKCRGNIHHLLCVTCCMSCVLFHMSNVMCMCHKWQVTCHVSRVTTYLFLNPTFGHVSWASWWRKRGVIAKVCCKGSFTQYTGCDNPSLWYKLHKPSVGLKTGNCVSKAKIPYP